MIEYPRRCRHRSVWWLLMAWCHRWFAIAWQLKNLSARVINAFQNHQTSFSWKWLYFDQNFTEICSQGFSDRCDHHCLTYVVVCLYASLCLYLYLQYMYKHKGNCEWKSILLYTAPFIVYNGRDISNRCSILLYDASYIVYNGRDISNLMLNPVIWCPFYCV